MTAFQTHQTPVTACVVIPTRNRAALAINAIHSVLEHRDGGTTVVVSDNSTDAKEVAHLADFCRRLQDPRVRYIRPPEPLRMTLHWEWALSEATRWSQASHLVYLTDRMVFRRGDLDLILRIARRYPTKVISYHHDRIVDFTTPVKLEQHPWSGQLLEVSTRRIAYLYSQALLPPCLPRMLNCIAPRAFLDAMSERFGNVFASISPDYNFGFRCLEVADSIIYLDKSAIIHYALDRSNGASYSRGVPTRDHADFVATLGDLRLNSATPIPEVQTVGNAIFHEYCTVKAETGSDRFPEINYRRYMAYLAAEIAEVEDENLRSTMAAALRARGLASSVETNMAAPRPRQQLSLRQRLYRTRRDLVRHARGGLIGSVAPSPKRRVRLLPFLRSVGRRLSSIIPQRATSDFPSVAEAIVFANRHPRRPGPSGQAQILQGEDLGWSGHS